MIAIERPILSALAWRFHVALIGFADGDLALMVPVTLIGRSKLGIAARRLLFQDQQYRWAGKEREMRMKKFINQPGNLVSELLEGLVLAFPGTVRLAGPNMVRAPFPRAPTRCAC